MRSLKAFEEPLEVWYQEISEVVKQMQKHNRYFPELDILL